MPAIETLTLYPFLTSLAITTVITFFTIKFVKKIGLMDDPKVHKHPAMLHSKPIPRGGGIPLFFGALITGFFFLPFTNPTVIAIFVASFLALFIGLIDDKLNAQSRDVSPYLRFLVTIITAVLVVGSGVSIHYITNPLGTGVIHLDLIKFSLPFLPFSLLLSDIVSVLWLIWVMNMTNWSKGVDGQMPGIVAIAAIVIGVLSLRLSAMGHGEFIDVKLSFIIAGAAI